VSKNVEVLFKVGWEQYSRYKPWWNKCMQCENIE